MRDLDSGDLQINIEEKNEKVVMKWLGKSRDRDPGLLLYPYFNDVINEMNNKELIIDFIKLEYMNSSTVPPILKLFKLLEEHNITTQILYDSQSGWQCASFKALSTIADTLKNVNIDGVS